MRLPFRPLPGLADETPRPVADVRIDGLEVAGVPCLIDTGSVHNRFAAWVAEEAGIDLRGVAPDTIGIGGTTVRARVATVGLTLGRTRWEAPVWFCERWPWEFNILGQEGFLRWFIVTIKTADRVVDVRALQK